MITAKYAGGNTHIAIDGAGDELLMELMAIATALAENTKLPKDDILWAVETGLSNASKEAEQTAKA